jgi:hypothetical protein
VSIRLLNCQTRNPSRSCISRSTSQSHSLSDSISQRASLFTYHLVRAGYSPVPSSRFTLITQKTLVSSPTDCDSSGLGSGHRTVTFAELATDPTQLTSSRPCHRHVTSLLETMSKLLEKAIAKWMQHDIVAHELIHTNQFGGHAHSSCLDTGLTLLHDVQSVHRAGLKARILLFDVRGFFDNVNHGRMMAILENSGYPPELVHWSEAFLRNRKVRLSFNNSTSEERGQPIGVLQGSPLSPVFSITYTSSLLAKMKGWNNSSLGMYVDDGILFACVQEWGEVERLLRARYTICEEWLRRSGLAIKPDKTELLFFQKPYEHNSVQAPSRLILLDPVTSSYYVVTLVENLRYLGFFINQRLKWEPHVWIMCNRARASIKALQVLGNSIRGLSMANWRLVLNAVCLPVLAYGSQIWFLSGASKTLVNMLQRVQNDMVKQVTGAFLLCHSRDVHPTWV